MNQHAIISLLVWALVILAMGLGVLIAYKVMTPLPWPL